MVFIQAPLSPRYEHYFLIITLLGYKFEKRAIINGEMKLSFFLMERDGRPTQVTTPPNIELEPFTLNIMEKDRRIGFVPLIYLKNLKLF